MGKNQVIMMFGKPEWFTPRKFGWGLGVKSWQGGAYIMAVAFLISVIWASPIAKDAKMLASVVFLAVVALDILDIMRTVYSRLDEREEKHQLIAERNASFVAVAAMIVYVILTMLSSMPAPKSPFSWDLLWNPQWFMLMGLLVLMAATKGVTLLVLERKN